MQVSAVGSEPIPVRDARANKSGSSGFLRWCKLKVRNSIRSTRLLGLQSEIPEPRRTPETQFPCNTLTTQLLDSPHFGKTVLSDSCQGRWLPTFTISNKTWLGSNLVVFGSWAWNTGFMGTHLHRIHQAKTFRITEML
jgi:hypothetical protein